MKECSSNEISNATVRTPIFVAGIRDRHITLEDRAQWLTSDIDNCSCCCELQAAGDQWPDEADKWPRSSRARRLLRTCGGCCVCVARCIIRSIKKLVEHKYFQQGILVAILINTLSMGIEYHKQVSVPPFPQTKHDLDGVPCDRQNRGSRPLWAGEGVGRAK